MNAVFIVGAPRSGTTLLQSIISSHSSFFSIPDTFFFSNTIPLLGVEYYNPNKEVNNNVLKIIEDTFYLMNGFQVSLCSKISNGMTIRGVFEFLMQEFNVDNKKYWVEKTTAHTICMLAIYRFYPNAKFIHIIRDPVDSISSTMNLRPLTITDSRLSYLNSCYSVSKMWKSYVSAVLRYPYQNNVLHVFYEELVLYPHENVLRVCNFLGVPFEDKMLVSFHVQAKNIISPEYNPHQRDNLLKGFHKETAHKWRKKLSPYIVWMIQRNVGYLAQYFGYYTTQDTNSNTKKFAYLLYDWLKWSLIHLQLEKIIRKIIGLLKR